MYICIDVISTSEKIFKEFKGDWEGVCRKEEKEGEK